MNVVWSKAELQFIRDNCKRLKDSELAATLSRLSGRPITMEACRAARQRLGIKKKPGRGRCELG